MERPQSYQQRRVLAGPVTAERQESAAAGRKTHIVDAPTTRVCVWLERGQCAALLRFASTGVGGCLSKKKKKKKLTESAAAHCRRFDRTQMGVVGASLMCVFVLCATAEREYAASMSLG